MPIPEMVDRSMKQLRNGGGKGRKYENRDQQ
jgi:hypothetical protein